MYGTVVLGAMINIMRKTSEGKVKGKKKSENDREINEWTTYSDGLIQLDR